MACSRYTIFEEEHSHCPSDSTIGALSSEMESLSCADEYIDKSIGSLGRLRWCRSCEMGRGVVLVPFDDVVSFDRANSKSLLSRPLSGLCEQRVADVATNEIASSTADDASGHRADPAIRRRTPVTLPNEVR